MKTDGPYKKWFGFINMIHMPDVMFTPPFIFMSVPTAVVTNLHLRQWRQLRPVQVQFLLQFLWGQEASTWQGCREADVQDPSRCCVQVWLNVKDKNILNRHGQHRWHALQEGPQERRQEVLLGHVLETDGDAAAQHVLGDDEDTQNALGRNAVNTIWKSRRGESREEKVRVNEYRVQSWGLLSVDKRVSEGGDEKRQQRLREKRVIGWCEQVKRGRD